MSVHIELAITKQDYGYCAAIRALVFVEEQNCNFFYEFDKHEETSQHFLLWDDEEPVATARCRKLDTHTAKIERIAVLKDKRQKSYGKNITSEVCRFLEQEGTVTNIVISAQDHALPFYTRLGFEVEGDGYMEADIPHHKMVMKIREAA